MERLLAEKAGGDAARPGGASPAWLRPRPPVPKCRHQAPAVFEPGRALEIELAAKGLRAVTLSPGSTGATT